MTCITDVRGDLKPESFGWLFKSPLAGGGRGHIVSDALQAAQLVLLLVVVKSQVVFENFIFLNLIFNVKFKKVVFFVVPCFFLFFNFHSSSSTSSSSLSFSSSFDVQFYLDCESITIT